jgi:hypothetical protein
LVCGKFELSKGVGCQFVVTAVLEDLKFCHPVCDHAPVFLLIEHDDYFDEGGLEALDALLQRTVVFAVVNALP